MRCPPDREWGAIARRVVQPAMMLQATKVSRPKIRDTTAMRAAYSRNQPLHGERGTGRKEAAVRVGRCAHSLRKLEMIAGESQTPSSTVTVVLVFKSSDTAADSLTLRDGNLRSLGRDSRRPSSVECSFLAQIINKAGGLVYHRNFAGAPNLRQTLSAS